MVLGLGQQGRAQRFEGEGNLLVAFNVVVALEDDVHVVLAGRGGCAERRRCEYELSLIIYC